MCGGGGGARGVGRVSRIPSSLPLPLQPLSLDRIESKHPLGFSLDCSVPTHLAFLGNEAHFLPPLPRRCRILSLACSKTIIEIYNLGPEGRMQDKNTVCSANLPLALQACLLESWHRGRGSGFHSWSDSPGQLSKQGLPAPRQLNLAPVFSEHCPGTSDRARSQDSTG